MEQANDQYQQALLVLTAKSEFDKSLGEDHELNSLPILLLSTAVFGLHRGQNGRPQPPTPVKFKLCRPTRRTPAFRYSATIRPATQMDLAFRMDGFVEAISEFPGTLLKKAIPSRTGTVLARFGQVDFEKPASSG